MVSDKIFKIFYTYRENKPRPLAAMFFDESKRLEHFFVEISKSNSLTFVQLILDLNISVGEFIQSKMG